MDCCLRQIEVLIFSVMGIKLGVDVTQVDGILDIEQASDSRVPFVDIRDMMKICIESVAYKAPKVLLIKRSPSPVGIIVDRLEEIEVAPLDRIQPMPPLIEKCAPTNAIWGSMVNGDEVILLIDFNKLPWPDMPLVAGGNVS